MINWKEVERGTKLILHPRSRSFGAPEGAIAIFARHLYNDDINVEWIDRERYDNHNQKNGHYSGVDFDIYENPVKGTCWRCNEKLKNILYGKMIYEICPKCEEI